MADLPLKSHAWKTDLPVGLVTGQADHDSDIVKIVRSQELGIVACMGEYNSKEVFRMTLQFVWKTFSFAWHG